MEKRLQELSEAYRAEAEERRKGFESLAGVLQKSLEAAAEDKRRLEADIRDLRNRPVQVIGGPGPHDGGPCVIF